MPTIGIHKPQALSLVPAVEMTTRAPISARIMSVARIFASIRGVLGHRHEPPPRIFNGAFAKRLDLLFDLCRTLFLLADLWGSRALWYP